MSVFKTLSHISKTPCKFTASLRVLQADIEEELRPELATFQGIFGFLHHDHDHDHDHAHAHEHVTPLLRRRASAASDA